MIADSALAQRLRAAGDERRLRLLRLCAEGPASVSALAEALADSEPTVSRQLKLLASAGLVTRSRQGQFVEYSLCAGSAAGAATVQWLLEQLGPEDVAHRAARARLRRACSAERRRIEAVPGLAAPSRFGRTLAAALSGTAVRDAHGRRALLRSRYPELVAVLAAAGAEISLLATSASERAALRRWAATQGLNAGVQLAAESSARGGSPPWSLVVLDDPGGEGAVGAALESDLVRAESWLAPGGRVWVLADYDVLERESAGQGSPLQRLRTLAQRAGLECLEMVPVDADGRHVLVATLQRGIDTPALAQSS